MNSDITSDNLSFSTPKRSQIIGPLTVLLTN